MTARLGDQAGAGAADEAGGPWSRKGLFLRLTEERKARLAELAAGLPAGATPTDAIDHGIEQALAAARPDEGLRDDRFDDLERAVARLGEEARADASRLAASVEALAKESSEPRSPNLRGWTNPAPSEAAGPLPAVSDWFDQAAASHGAPVKRAVLAKGRWLATRATLAGRLSMEFEMSAVAFDGARAAAAGPARAARLEGVEPGSPLARFQSPTPVYFAAQPVADSWGSRWTLTAFASAADGSVGAALRWLAPDA